MHHPDPSPLFSGGRLLLILLLVTLVLLYRDFRAHPPQAEPEVEVSWIAVKHGDFAASFHPIRTGDRLGSLVQTVLPQMEPFLSPICREQVLEPGTEIRLFMNGRGPELACLSAPLPERCRYLLGLPMNLNRAGKTELTFLPGVGEKLAERILVERERNGGFSAVEDLLPVRGIGNRLMDKIKERVSVTPLSSLHCPESL